VDKTQEELVCVRDHLQAIQTIVDLHQATLTTVDHHQARADNLAEDHHQATLRIEVQAASQANQAHNARVVNQVLQVLQVLQELAIFSATNEPDIFEILLAATQHACVL